MLVSERPYFFGGFGDDDSGDLTLSSPLLGTGDSSGGSSDFNFSPSASQTATLLGEPTTLSNPVASDTGMTTLFSTPSSSSSSSGSSSSGNPVASTITAGTSAITGIMKSILGGGTTSAAAPSAGILSNPQTLAVLGLGAVVLIMVLRKP